MPTGRRRRQDPRIAAGRCEARIAVRAQAAGRRQPNGAPFLATFALTLVLLSAVIHASWNIMARSSHSETSFIRQMLPMVAAVGFVPAAVGQWLTHSMSTMTWAYVASSGSCCAFYFYSLGKAYENSDFTTVYPMARSLPVLLIAIGDALQGATPSPVGWLGMACVVIGCMMAPLRSREDVALKHYINRGSLWILLTALGTVGYSLLDKRASGLLPPGPASAAIYCYYFYFFTFVAYGLLAELPRPRAENQAGSSFWMASLAGGMSAAAYFLVLWSFQLVAQASYVVAFRQASLIIAVLMAFALYREERHLVRLAAVLVITAGLVLIKVFG